MGLGCVVCGLLPLLVFAAAIAEARRSASHRQQAAVQSEARIQANALSAMFTDWQRAMLVLARNGAFVDWYLDPALRPRLDGSIREALVVLEQVYPNRVDAEESSSGTADWPLVVRTSAWPSSHVRIAGVLRQQFSVAAGIGVHLGELAEDSDRIGRAIGVVNDTAVAVAELRRSVESLTTVVRLLDR